jgi:hypothetical protein
MAGQATGALIGVYDLPSRGTRERETADFEQRNHIGPLDLLCLLRLSYDTRVFFHKISSYFRRLSAEPNQPDGDPQQRPLHGG